ncbi:MAG: coniferyl aldehyde dehydrogenase [Rhodospirillales bacterium]
MDQFASAPGGIEELLSRLLERQRAAFMAAPRPTARERAEHLQRLETAVKKNQDAIANALGTDFGNRARPETVLAEILPTIAACGFARKHLAGWMRPQRRAVGLNFKPAVNRVEYTPKGVVGVVAPWNYPIYLTLGPLVDILAAGNRCMIKPSELTPATSALLAKLLGDIFPPEQVAVVQGDVAVGRAFCALKFDHLLYTGSTHVGREVMRAAAENLVPVTLELGGKSPVIVAEDYDVGKAAKSVAVGKFFNAGQTCVSPDYALVTGGRAEKFAHSVLAAAEAMYPKLDGNPDYTAVISDRHHARLTGLVAEAEAAGATILRHRDKPTGNTRHFPPTVVLNPPLDGKLMQDEIFGPILPVVRTENLDAALDFVNTRPRPLALYAYTNDSATERKILDQTISGGVTVNSTMLHVAQDDMPFGGIGPSGIGAYHGHEGFLEFSHTRSLHKPRFFTAIEILKPPYATRMRLALKMLAGFELK